MGEEKKKDKSGADGAGDGGKKKDAAAGGEKAAAAGPIVLKVELHCAGCASKVKKAIKRASGVETVTTDTAGNKVVVTGAADAAELKERVEARTKKPVQIVSAGAGPPKKEKDKEEKKDKDKKGGDSGEKKAEKEKGGGGEKKAEKEKGGGGGGEKKSEKEEKKPKEPKEETVTLKIRLHCDGCIDRIKRRISRFKGVKDVTVDAAKDLVKVTGTMDAAALPGYLKEKLSRPVEVVAPGKKDAGGDKKDGAKDGGEKKDKKDAGGGGGEEKKDKDKSAAASASVAPAPLADAGMYQMPPPYGFNPYHGHHHPAAAAGGYYGGVPPPNAAGFYHHPNAGAGAVPYQPYAYNVHAPQMFSDENPNACSVM